MGCVISDLMSAEMVYWNEKKNTRASAAGERRKMA